MNQIDIFPFKLTSICHSDESLKLSDQTIANQGISVDALCLGFLLRV